MLAANGKWMCRHCRRVKSRKCRGLCWKCFGTPAVRGLYPAVRVRSAVGEFTGPAPPPDEPTAAIPGSAGKVLVMMARAAKGTMLFHPKDRQRVMT